MLLFYLDKYSIFVIQTILRKANKPSEEDHRNPNLMKQQLNTGMSGTKRAGLPLRNLVNQLVSDSLATAVQQKSIIVNEVPSNMHIAADEAMLSPVIGELLATVVANSKKGSIYISAERFSDVVIFSIQDRNTNNGYALAYSIKSIEPMAAELGGFITIKGQQQLETTISLSFPNHQAVQTFDC